MREFSIRSRFDEACDLLGVTLKALCERADVRYATLHAQLVNDRKIPFETIDAICHAWPLPLDHFSPNRAQTFLASAMTPNQTRLAALDKIEQQIQIIRLSAIEQKPAINTFDVLDWVRRGGPAQGGSHAILDYCDLFYPMDPEDNAPTPYAIGSKSGSTRAFRVSGPDEYSRKVRSINPSVLREIKAGHMEVRTRPYDISDVELRANVEGCSMVFEVYCRLMARIRLPNNQELTLVHAQTIPDAPTVPREQSEYLKTLLLDAH